MNKLLILLIIGLAVFSCKNQGKSDPAKKDFYWNAMAEKNFQLEKNGPCDDAIEDTLHDKSVAYIDSKTLTDTNAIIQFKFIEACCQEFLGDYSIKNDTLKFQFEQVNDEVCECQCWYKYKLTINEPLIKYNDIKIELK